MMTATSFNIRCMTLLTRSRWIISVPTSEENLPTMMSHRRYMSSYYDDRRFTDRMAMLRRQQLELQKKTRSEQLLGLQHHHSSNIVVTSNNNSDDPFTPPTSRMPYNMKELRTAYFQAAKQCHPDSQKSYNKQKVVNHNLFKSDETSEERFIMVTEAYEYLRQQFTTVGTISNNDNLDSDDDILSDEEEEQKYRKACLDILGQPAEIVEESKRCPIFRQWLFGRTDAAFYWQSFFMLHGGLAPQLRTTSSTGATTKLLSQQTTNDDTDMTTTTAAAPIQRRRRPPSR